MSGAFEVRMPRLSESMAEGTIVRWLHAPGARVCRGEELVEIETDKAIVSFEAEQAGVLEVLVPAGQARPVGALIARVRDGDAGPGRVPASPLARRLARERGVDLAALQGSGPGGRVVRADIEAAAHIDAAAGAEDGSEATVREPNRARQLMTQRMVASASEIPSFRLRSEIDMTEWMRLRAQTDQMTADRKPTLTALAVAACGRALREFPEVNASYREGRIERHGTVNVAVAVAAPRVLVAPVVPDADRRSLTWIARRVREVAERARAGRIGPAELEGATFTVSNLGMFGVTEFDALVTPPQAAVLAVGGVRRVPWVVDGPGGDAVEVRAALTVTLTCDHRVLDGAEAARFLARVHELLQRPIALLLDSGGS